MIEASDFPSVNALDRLRIAFNSAEKHRGLYPPEACCFVHGDFHHGNILA